MIFDKYQLTYTGIIVPQKANVYESDISHGRYTPKDLLNKIPWGHFTVGIIQIKFLLDRMMSIKYINIK